MGARQGGRGNLRDRNRNHNGSQLRRTRFTHRPRRCEISVMPEQKSLTIDGTQVLWKHYRRKQGDTDAIKICVGRQLPEKHWQSISISHAVVDSCTTTSALSATVRKLIAEHMGVTVKASKDSNCCDCKRHGPSDPPTDISDPGSLSTPPVLEEAPPPPVLEQAPPLPVAVGPEDHRKRRARVISALNRAVEPTVRLAFDGALTNAEAQRMTSGSLLHDFLAESVAGTDADHAADAEVLAASLTEDRVRRESIISTPEAEECPSTHVAEYSAAFLHRTVSLLRYVFTQRASYALFTVEWQRSLAHALVTCLGVTRVLEVCCGRNLLTGPMGRRGLEWCATDSKLPPAFDASARTRTSVAATAHGLATESDVRDASSRCALDTTEVTSALEVVRTRLALTRRVDAVFYSWWPAEEVDEDYLVACECLEAGVPLIFVGEPQGGCTGSTMFWQGGLPIRRLADVVATTEDPAEKEDEEVQTALGLWKFEDVVQWPGCHDSTWCVLPPGMSVRRSGRSVGSSSSS